MHAAYSVNNDFLFKTQINFRATHLNSSYDIVPTVRV